MVPGGGEAVRAAGWVRGCATTVGRWGCWRHGLGHVCVFVDVAEQGRWGRGAVQAWAGAGARVRSAGKV